MNRGDLSFGLLGPLAVRSATHGQLHIRSPKHRILLAALLLAPGQAVPVANLAEAVWGTRPPANARRALQLHVLRVRALFMEAGLAPVIARDAGGYRIDIDANAVDAWSVTRLVDEADAAARRTDPQNELAALSRALDLWRGEPLCDVPSDLLHGRYVPVLDEQQLRIVERYHDVGLQLGRFDETAESALRHLARYPLAEPLWHQLITALHSSGRRADALQAYHQARQQLAADLGVGPGRALQRLYASVLSGHSATADLAGPPDVPRQLPNAIAGFVGRSPELRQLEALIDRSDRQPAVAALTGMGGIGKTALAAHFARRAADAFPDGQLWIDLRGYDARPALTPTQALTILLRSLGEQSSQMPTDLDGLTERYRSVMADRRALIVLDNARDAGQVRALLPGGSPSLLLITSRHMLSDVVVRARGQALRLEPLDRQEACALLTARLGADRVDGEPEAVNGIVDVCGGLPLALAIVAAHGVACPTAPLADLPGQLQAADADLDRFSSNDVRADVRTVLSWSYQALGPQAAQLFRRLGLHPSPAIREAAAAGLVEAGPAGVRPLLDELVAEHLIAEPQPGSFVMNRLVHAYAVELARAFDSARRRVLARYGLLDRLARHGRASLAPDDGRRWSVWE
ncbi:BTAD domain-containing putative transcriptional regulator [Micromonospora sp. NPDC047740]|uniref:AfsR/SARP family transcriptional regulator n=1 Tax=Micromonospora sp. NPDC047740 TaxID=3364254 RepID=UPI00371D9B91